MDSKAPPVDEKALLGVDMGLPSGSSQALVRQASDAPPAFVDVAIVVPAYNEEGAVQEGIDELRRVLEPLPITWEIVVVNDGSTDDTGARAEQTCARVIHKDNGGYGSALKLGIANTNSRFVVITDADGTYPATALPEMFALARHCDMVVGDRGAAMKNVPLVRRPAKWVLNRLAGFLARRRITDLNSGLRVFRRSALEKFIPLLPEGFSFTTTITLCMICSGLRVVYHPIEYGRRTGNSKIKPTDFFAFILLVLRVVMLFAPLRVFLPLGAVFIVAGIGKGIYDVFLWNLSESAVLSFVAGMMAWSLGLLADMISRLHLRP